MNNFIAGVVAVLVAAFGWVLFGKPKGETENKSESTEIVTPPQTQSPPPELSTPSESDHPSAGTAEVTVTEEPTATEGESITELPAQAEEPVDFSHSASTGQPSTDSSSISNLEDPWADPSTQDSTEGSITFDAITATDLSEPSDETPIEINVDDATQVIESEELSPSPPVASTRYNVGEPITEAPFAAIQDPKRPKTPELQDLSQQILDWGTSRLLSNVPKVLTYATHNDPLIRSYVALALGQIAAPHTVKAEIEKVIPVLGKLSQDSNGDVRAIAMKALSSIQSPDVLPFLEKGLLSASGPVKQAANTAIQKLKLNYGSQPDPSEIPPSLQKKP
ncbi:HEAT repeat domain-containing protein [Alkalinema sp. FACHB-956]|uniref:HEAT repeat domain-containing protein n=1 Tax=Alkalinema sp. FACHB-956 TaxID=2692768 RepID=UPI001687D51A|nr:HEAT repeat domain-containing protein [Alkalinema sp. FACHB-956]MBD2329986.1 HEAT repeat domain-containing protein [Alkalinema sp. FACHB-956]